MEETADEFVLVPGAADLPSYYDDDDAHEALVLVGDDGRVMDVNYFAVEPASSSATALSSVEGGASVDDDDDGLAGAEEEVGVAEEQGGEKDGEGDDHGWQQHAVGVLCSVGLAAAATGLSLLLGGHQQQQHRPPHKVRFRDVAGDRKQAAKVSAAARRDARLEQGMSVPRVGQAPAVISFGGCCNDGQRWF